MFSEEDLIVLSQALDFLEDRVGLTEEELNLYNEIKEIQLGGYTLSKSVCQRQILQLAELLESEQWLIKNVFHPDEITDDLQKLDIEKGKNLVIIFNKEIKNNA